MTMTTVVRAPTARQLDCIRAYCATGSQIAAAHSLGITTQTLKNHMLDLYQRLGVGGAMEAAMALGYVTLPDDDGRAICGWLGYCSRTRHHRGQHGGFRAFAEPR